MAGLDLPIYLDYNATTPLDPKVKQDMISALDLWRNPSSSYAKEIKLQIEEARENVGTMINVQDWQNEIIFTSGGTESNNWVLLSAAAVKLNAIRNGSCSDVGDSHGHSVVPHFITSNIEHDAIRIPIENMVSQGKIECTFVPVEKDTGAVNVNKCLSEIKPNTVLITLMLANNETGIIQPVEEICYLLKSINETRIQSNLPKIYSHSDAAQAIGKIPVDVQSLHLDFMTIVGHKFYGPRIGALYVRNDLPISPLFYGGGQERNLRPGTENTPCIIGLGAAAKIVTKNIDAYQTQFINLKKHFTTKLKQAFTNEQLLINFENCNQLPNTISLSIVGTESSGKNFLKLFGNELQASTGSACHSNLDIVDASCNGDTLIPASVLISSGLTPTVARKTIRLSLGRETSKEQLDQVVIMFQRLLYEDDVQ